MNFERLISSRLYFALLRLNVAIMYKFGEINSYEGVLDLKEVVKEVNVGEMEEALNICDLSTLSKKYKTWIEHMPRVKPYYGQLRRSICNIIDMYINS